jgi:ammonia channel protein AmtB
VASLIGVAVNAAWVIPVSALALFAIGKLVRGNRVAEELEERGLDVAEVGVLGYSPDTAIPEAAPVPAPEPVAEPEVTEASP